MGGASVCKGPGCGRNLNLNLILGSVARLLATEGALIIQDSNKVTLKATDRQKRWDWMESRKESRTVRRQ